MGDKPTPIENTNSCPLSPWPDGLLPDSVTVVLSGIEKGPTWSSTFPEPPEGSFKLDFLGCVVWSYDDDDYKIEAKMVGDEFHVYMFSKPYAFNFATAGDVEEPYEHDNEHSSQNVYAGGSAFINDLGLTGKVPPASWDAGILFGVPQQPGYFAEEFPSNIAGRYLRYASHATKTNFKVWMD